MDPPQMAPGPKLAAVAGVAADKLWQYQLRKENKALQEQIQENEKRRQLDAAEAERKFKESADRIIALEARVSETEHEMVKSDQVTKELEMGQKAFRLDLMNFLQGRIPEAELHAIMRGPATNSANSAPPSATQSLHDAALQPKASGGPPSRRYFKPVPVARIPITVEQETRNPNTKRNGDGHKTARCRSKPTVERRPVTRSRNKAANTPMETSVERPPPRAAIQKFPSLAQGTHHIKTYFNKANEVFKSLKITDAQMEVDFISAFIGGVTDPKVGKKLVTELQQLHPSRNGKDGKIEVICEWDDIPEGLRRAGLLSPAKEPSRRKHKVLGDLSDFAF